MVSESKFENSKHSTFNLILLGNGTGAAVMTREQRGDRNRSSRARSGRRNQLGRKQPGALASAFNSIRLGVLGLSSRLET